MEKLSEIKFDSEGLVPAIAQDIHTRRVLMLAYMNREAIEKTVWSGKAHYWSRSRNKLWLKGETSGNFQYVKGISYDCDGDTLLLLVDPEGPACHTGEVSCFYRTFYGEKPAPGPGILGELFKVIKERKKEDPEKSYVAKLYSKGLREIMRKVMEESGELLEAAETREKKEIVHELTDLWFHTMVLLSHKGIELEEVFHEFERRFGTSGVEEKKSRGKE